MKMKITGPLFLFCGAFLLAVVACTEQDFPVLRGPYLGQALPGTTPEVFAPGVVSKQEYHEGCSGFMNDGDLFVFSTVIPGSDWKHKPTFFIRMRGGRWTRPVLVPFNDLSPYNFTVGPDGKTLYFTSLRSEESTSHLLKKSNIWLVRFDGGRWSTPTMLGPEVNSKDYGENYPSVSKAGSVYFASDRPPCLGEGDIYVFERAEGVSSSVRNLGPAINTQYREDDPFVAADGSYLIFCSSRPGGYGLYDLYISFRTTDGGWTEARNMGPEINTAGEEARPSVTPDGRFLFFSRGNVDPDWRDIFWVDTEVIRQLNPQDEVQDQPP